MVRRLILTGRSFRGPRKKPAMRRITTLLALLISTMLVGNGVAHADVVVPPGGSGHTCSGYSYVQLNPNLYWQTCAWADADEVWFTVNFGNASSSTWYVDEVDLRPIRSGVVYQCTLGSNFPVPPHSTPAFPSPPIKCGWPRSSAAYAARAYVRYNNYYYGMTSPTLQVQ